MVMNLAAANAAFTPDDIGALVVKPAFAGSIAGQIATRIVTNSYRFRIPIVSADPSAAWTAEGAEITTSESDLDEIDVTPSKLAGLTIITRELANDTSPSAQQLVGDGLARDLGRKIDAAFFGTTVTNGPSGLGSITAAGHVFAGATWTNTDPFTEAIFNAEVLNSQVTAFVANPADALALATLKDQDDSNRPLLQPDATLPTRRSLAGVPLWTSPAVTAGTVWGVPRAHVLIVEREGATLDVDSSAYFTSDRIAIRATLRLGFGFPLPEAVQKITLS